MHDFKDKQLGKAIPYGVYDIAANQGWLNVGIDHDTAHVAVNSIRSWWQHVGAQRYPDATTCRRPQDGVRGLDAYRESWGPFFAWLASAGAAASMARGNLTEF